jgi:hypothetical protein
MPIATDHNVERIAIKLLRYLREDCMTEHMAKLAVCEALYEMRAIATGEAFKPTVMVTVGAETKSFP